MKRARFVPLTGEREIVDEEAVVVRRILTEFHAGLSPRAIARRLNAEFIQPLCNGTSRHARHGFERFAQRFITFGGSGGLLRRQRGIAELDAACFRGSESGNRTL